MFEAKLSEAGLLKKVIESIRENVTDANLDCTPAGISMQAMDSNHVSLCAFNLRNDGFDRYRCDRNITLGINLGNISKILKCAGNSDIVTLKAEDEANSLTITFEAPKQERMSEFEMKLIVLNTERLAIPETEYSAQIRMPSAEFQRIVRDLIVIGDTCTISCRKDCVRFGVSGDLGAGSVTIKQNTSTDKDEERVEIVMQEPTELSFALRYLNSFIKATPLGPVVALSLDPKVPLCIEYPIDTTGHVQFYLAPKIDEEE